MAEREQIPAVRCANCAHFIAGHKNNVVDIGSCQKYEDYKNKGATVAQLGNAFITLGARAFFGDDIAKNDRFCPKFESK
jgi:hypothetical protein